jgi:Tfp pilus assembly protein PilO
MLKITKDSEIMIRQKWIMICASTGTVVLIYLLVFFLPAVKELNCIKAQVAANVFENGAAGEKIVMASNLTNALKSTRQQLENLKIHIPDETSKLEILHAIEKISRESKTLNDVSLQILGSETLFEGGIRKQLFEIGFNGTYEEIARFLHNATHLPNIIAVENLIISTSVKGKLTVKAVMACYLTTGKDTLTKRNLPTKQDN